ncbi:extracellular solute-binding protein [Paenibacillus contaminans]|uniref:ABC transporter substrate-binding protein n=1 Tax=Paenibacillus contaminans TaxID=450362 RepID=A0A329MVT9_9BACL|nr:extracellular solute-binding protein [Paenibacillus contaminans]RAV22007.1 hypothetical protein DQG23_08185 [Paenibacillus contaminans]
MRAWKTGITGTLLVSLAVTGCSSSTKENGAASSSPSPSGGATSSEPAKGEKLTLKWFVNAPNNYALPSKDKDFIKKAIDEKFNVDLQITHMQVGDEYTNKLNLLIAGGDLPDMFMADGAASNKYILDGVPADLTKYVTPQTMPNYFKWVKEDELKRYQVQDVFKRAPIPFAKQQYASYYVRKDWLDTLGLKVPETYDDMINVMKAFTEKDPDGNGKNDTFGFTTSGGGTTVSLEWPEYGKNGLVAGFILENGQFIDAQSDIRVGTVIDDIRKVINMKIVDPDWFLQKSPEHVNKAASGKAGIVYGGTRDFAFDNGPNSVQKKTKDILKDDKAKADKVDWQPFHPFASVGVGYEALPAYPFLFGAKTSEAKIKRSVEILDWLASEEGFLLTHYGQNGVHYTKEGNKIKINAEAYKKDILDQGNFAGIYAFYTPDEPQVLGLEKIDPNETDRDRAILKKVTSYKYVQSLGTNVAPPTGLDLGAFRTQMRKVISKMLLEDKDSSQWPAYREELMGKYKGKDIFDAYATQVSKVQGKTYTFK